MNTKSKKHAKIFRIAWSIMKSGQDQTISQSLKKAWIIGRISDGQPVNITFAKKDTGEERTAVAIQVGSLETIKSGFIRFVELVNGTAQWRSFNIKNLAA